MTEPDTSSATSLGRRAAKAYQDTGVPTPNPFGDTSDENLPAATMAFAKAWSLGFAEIAYPPKN